MSQEAAMYHFVTGFTAKLAGTELGVKEPVPTFSTCFGEPFMPMDPSVYAKMLGERLEKHNTKVYLINTGWSGGAYGTGKRINLKYTRAMVTAVLSGYFDNAEYKHDEIFNLDIPQSCPGVPSEIMNPIDTWADRDKYIVAAKKLANLFYNNFKEKYPNRFFELGISEADMIGTAAGMATCGKKPFVATFAAFATGRVYDQIRCSIAYPNLNVKIIGTHAGITVGEDGATHQMLEDINLMRAMPNMLVISPSDDIQAKILIKKLAEYEGPAYVRLSRMKTPVLIL